MPSELELRVSPTGHRRRMGRCRGIRSRSPAGAIGCSPARSAGKAGQIGAESRRDGWKCLRWPRVGAPAFRPVSTSTPKDCHPERTRPAPTLSAAEGEAARERESKDPYPSPHLCHACSLDPTLGQFPRIRKSPVANPITLDRNHDHRVRSRACLACNEEAQVSTGPQAKILRLWSFQHDL